MSLPQLLQQYQARVNTALAKILPTESAQPTDLHRAMRYVVLGGGKRIRALLIYTTGAAFNVNPGDLDNIACAVELIHAYSLVHDDLPAMDDDDLRRGKPTCHKAFNEAIAILVGDALQSLAFELLAKESATLTAPQRLRMLAILAHAIGSHGMAGGQALDLAAENKSVTLTQLENIHQLKTGAFITACVQLGAIAGNCQDKNQFEYLTLFAEAMGLAFQIQDDILDIESPTEMLGKKQGADLAKQKSTYPALMGLTAAKEKVETLYQQASNYLEKLNISTQTLQQLAEFIIQRQN